MWVRGASIENFRNFKKLDISLSRGINIIYGSNAQGKTNFLEALYFCATGRSTRAASDRELIRFGESEARLRVAFMKDETVRTVGACVKHEGSKTIKSIAVDQIPVRKTNELFGLLLTVTFSPDDLSLIKAGPSERRAYMDFELCQISPVYCHELRSYYHALKQRNALLKILQKERKTEDVLDVWDEQLCRYGRKLMNFRLKFVEQASIYASETHAHMTGGTENLSMIYRPGIKDADDYETVLQKNRGRDILLGSTSSGVHKDDIQFLINGHEARTFGSQGQQRTAALSAKLAEIEIIRENTGETPVLLLDDVLSELDGKRQRWLLSRIGSLQTVLTCTGVEDILKKCEGNIMKMENGELKYGV